MKKNHFLLIIVMIILLSVIILRIKSHLDNQNSLNKIERNTVSSVPIINDVPEDPQDETLIISEVDTIANKNLMIIHPESGQLITSPLAVKGRISGTWFFEGSMPISLVDANGVIIAQHYVTSDEDWMTIEPVNFSGSIEFNIDESTSDNGYLIISKDNPSDLLENSGSIRMPIRFK